ncbi:MAG: hypothetical protein ACRDNZ_06965 [Streptosporangiaceae bacterium]
MAWTVTLVAEVEDWFLALDERTAELVGAAIDRLEASGPALPGRWLTECGARAVTT